MPHPRDEEQLARHALEQKLRRQWAAKTGRALESLDRQQMFNKHGGKCIVCRERIAGAWHEEHRVALVNGGVNEYSNVGPAHPECNLAKGRA